MTLPLEQLNKIIKSARKILLTGPANPNIDVLCSSVAWFLYLAKIKKSADIVFAGTYPRVNFLPKVGIAHQLEGLGKFKIIVDTSHTKVKQLSYDLKNNKLEINIVPAGGNFQDSDVATSSEGYQYDLIICLGAANLEILGELFTQNKNFFWQTPIINIDRSVLNENFGQLNVVASSATAIAEISYPLMKDHLDKDISTALLAGMISATNSFQSPQVIPETLELASRLIVSGAKRAEIVEELYRTKDIATLKNWGKVLSRLHKSNNIITSYLRHGEVSTLPQDWQELVKDLILSTPQSQVAIIFYQLELRQTEAWIYTISNINAQDLVKDLSPGGSRHFASITMDTDLDSAKESLTQKIQAKLDIVNKVE